jgi:hypothetical protein
VAPVMVAAFRAFGGANGLIIVHASRACAVANSVVPYRQFLSAPHLLIALVAIGIVSSVNNGMCE